MEVILKKDLDNVGKAGAVVRVKDGFGRNFLIPNGLALPLNASNLKNLEQEKQRKASALEKAKQEALSIKERLSGFSLTIPALVQEKDSLYGGISSQDIVSALKEEGFDIDKQRIHLEEPIKSLGIYELPVNLHPEVIATLKVWIVKK